MTFATVRVRVTASAVVLTAVALGLGAWGLVRAVERTQVAEISRDMDSRVNDIVLRLQQGDSAEHAVTVASGSGGDGMTFAAVCDPGGELLASAPVLPEHAAPFEAPRRAGGVPCGAGFVTATSGGETVSASADVELATREVDVGGERLLVAAAHPLAEVRRSLDALQQSLWIGVPAVVALVGGLAWLATGRALRPVEAMRAEVEEISHSTLHRRVPEPAADDEVARLARTMNAMLDRLESASERQRRFVADASHELRSPVAALRAELEVALGTAKTEEELRAAIAGALAEEVRIEDLLADLLVLASLQEGAAPPDAPVHLADVAAAEAAVPRRVPVRVSGAGLVRGSPMQLRRLVANLLDNAARHARAAVVVTIDGGRLVVDDDGPGIPEDDRERVFERFTRLDEARARDDGGAGLGLALVRSVAAAHRGRAWIETAPTGGARVVVELPTG